jgi:hypothetical protein
VDGALLETHPLDEADRAALARAAASDQGNGPAEGSRHLNIDP